MSPSARVLWPPAEHHARIDPAAAGLPLTAFLQLHCRPGRCLLKSSAAEEFPEIVEIHRLSGSSCTMVKALRLPPPPPPATRHPGWNP